MKNETVNKIVSIVLKVVPLAMGAAVVALSALKQLSADGGVTMLGIGMFFGALGQLRRGE